jgi:hypothetical protein
VSARILSSIIRWRRILMNNVLRETCDTSHLVAQYQRLTHSKTSPSCSNQANHISKEAAVTSLKTWLPLQDSSWYQEEFWDQAPEKLFSSSLALQNAKDTPWERAQLFPVDHTRNNDFVRWCTSFENTFQERHDLCEAETVCSRYDEARYSRIISIDWDTFLHTAPFE